MAISKNNLAFRNQLAEELKILKTVLLKENLPRKSIDSLDQAIKSLQKKDYLPKIPLGIDKFESTENSWGYSINNFILDVDLDGHTQYPKAVKKAKATLSVKITGEYSSDSEFNDPFKTLEFNLVIKGKSRKEKDHILALHLDKQPESKNSPIHAHPVYHFQIGGDKLKNLHDNGFNFGNNLILDSPRLMHYPMDFILGIDFLFSNFAPEIWRNIRKNPHFLKVFKEAQRRNIRPYFARLAQHFDFHVLPDGDWDSKAICPQFH